MAATIEVAKTADDEFQVRVIEGRSATSHRVMLSQADHERISGGKVEPAELIRRSFEFLLEHEPKESILSRFDLTVISRYFPSYEREIRKRL